YMLLPRSGWQWNVCFTLALGLMWASVYRDVWRTHAQQQGLGALRLPVFVVLSFVAWWWLGYTVEYGHVGGLFVPVLFFAMQAWLPNTGLHIATPLAALGVLLVLVNAGLLNSSLITKSRTVLNTAGVSGRLLVAARWVANVALHMPRITWLSEYPAHLAAIAAGAAVLN